LQRRLTVLSVSSASCTHRACGARSMAKCLTCENEQGRGNVPNSYYVELAILITRTSAYACVCCSYSDVKVDNIIAFFFFELFSYRCFVTGCMIMECCACEESRYCHKTKAVCIGLG
jgi:hypothetical protein